MRSVSRLSIKTDTYGGSLGDKNYCYVCRVGVTYDAEKIENLIKIADVTYNFFAIRKDIQILDVSLWKKLENEIWSLRMDLS